MGTAHARHFIKEAIVPHQSLGKTSSFDPHPKVLERHNPKREDAKDIPGLCLELDEATDSLWLSDTSRERHICLQRDVLARTEVSQLAISSARLGRCPF